MKRRLYTLLISFLLSFPAVLSVYASTPADSTKVTGNDIVQRAMKYIGVPYRSGRMNPKVGFDCSGFTSYVFKKENILLTHSSRSQFTQGIQINDCKELHKGDLVFSAVHATAVRSDMWESLRKSIIKRGHFLLFTPAVQVYAYLHQPKPIIRSAM